MTVSRSGWKHQRILRNIGYFCVLEYPEPGKQYWRKTPKSPKVQIRLSMHTEINNRSNVIDFLNERFPEPDTEPDTVVCYLYCNYKEPEHTAFNLVAILLWKMVLVQPKTPRNIAALQQKNENKTKTKTWTPGHRGRSTISYSRNRQRWFPKSSLSLMHLMNALIRTIFLRGQHSFRQCSI